LFFVVTALTCRGFFAYNRGQRRPRGDGTDRCLETFVNHRHFKGLLNHFLKYLSLLLTYVFHQKICSLWIWINKDIKIIVSEKSPLCTFVFVFSSNRIWHVLRKLESRLNVDYVCRGSIFLNDTQRQCLKKYLSFILIS